MVPRELEELLGPCEYYIKVDSEGTETMDLCQCEAAHTMQVAVWFHQVDMANNYGRAAPLSLNSIHHHHEGTFLQFFLACGNCPLTFKAVVQQVMCKNEREACEDLEDTKEKLATAWMVKRAIAAKFEELNASYKEHVWTCHDKRRATKMRNKKITLLEQLMEAKNEVCELRWRLP